MKTAFLSCLIVICSLSLVAQTKLYPYRKANAWGYCNENKKVIVPTIYNITYPHTSGMGLIISYDSAQKKYFYGFVDEAGKVVIQPQYISAGFFANDRSIIKNADGRFGVIDKKGKIIIDPVYPKIIWLEKAGLFKVTNDSKKVTLFDLKGKKLFDFKYDDIDDASTEWHAILTTDNAGKQYCTWTDRKGKEVPVKLAAAEEFIGGLAPARDLVSNKMGYMNTKGEWVIAAKYWMTKPFSDGIGLIANSQTNTRWMYLNAKGDTLLNKLGYSRAESFNDGLALIDGKFVTKEGKPFSPSFNYCFEFRGGLAQVRTVGQGMSTPDWQLINREGKVIATTPYSGGSFAYREAGPVLKQELWKYGVMDRNGNMLVAPKYDRLSFRNGMVCTSYQDKNYNEVITGYLTEKGVECWDQ